jgi:hypothetical protein
VDTTIGLAALFVLGLILLVAIRIRLDAIQSRIAAVARVEAKLDLLLKQANIEFDPYAYEGIHRRGATACWRELVPHKT